MSLNQESLAIWERKAEFWDSQYGEEGNWFHRELVAPAALHLLQPQPQQTILDLACGNGVMARTLARLGSEVVAVDGSAKFIELAKTRALGDQIQWGVVDAMDETALLALGEERFDSILCNMAFMDIPELEPLFKASARLLKNGGVLVFSQLHPCFSTAHVAEVLEKSEENGQQIIRSFLKVMNYLTTQYRVGVGMSNEPEPHYYFHRPLQELLAGAFTAGLVLDGVLEPALPAHREWRKEFREFPPVLVGRFRRIN